VVDIGRFGNAAWAMMAVYPEKGEPAEGWVLELRTDGIGGECLAQYEVPLIEPVSRAQCVLDAQEALEVEYNVTPNNPPPLARAEYMWDVSVKEADPD
jgi:hypothetical protein